MWFCVWALVPWLTGTAGVFKDDFLSRKAIVFVIVLGHVISQTLLLCNPWMANGWALPIFHKFMGLMGGCFFHGWDMLGQYRTLWSWIKGPRFFLTASRILRLFSPSGPFPGTLQTSSLIFSLWPEVGQNMVLSETEWHWHPETDSMMFRSAISHIYNESK